MLSVGDKAPDFVLPTVLGGQTALQDMTCSGPVLLAFFKVSCPTCQYTLPFLQRLTEAKDLRITGISQDNRRTTANFCREFGISFPVAVDNAAANYPVSNAYKITHVPSLFLVEGESITQAFHGFSRRELEAIGSRFGASVFVPFEKIPDFRPG